MERLKVLEEAMSELRTKVEQLDEVVSNHDVRIDAADAKMEQIELTLTSLTTYVTRAFTLLTEQKLDLHRIDSNVRTLVELARSRPS